ncbi:hypothetical protein EVAR_98057_1 [Eumeta japonica]|uniref:Uncharacterized protein n=1 Tax=Eumeta variegata TaxID=151549 RepID=A0A4C1WCU3_EUMVA|nr:hypothetical protein EVAR_98057_1 [Eumeta japonica]
MNDGRLTKQIYTANVCGGKIIRSHAKKFHVDQIGGVLKEGQILCTRNQRACMESLMDNAAKTSFKTYRACANLKLCQYPYKSLGTKWVKVAGKYLNAGRHCPRGKLERVTRLTENATIEKESGRANEAAARAPSPASAGAGAAAASRHGVVDDLDGRPQSVCDMWIVFTCDSHPIITGAANHRSTDRDKKTVQWRWFPRTVELFDEERYRLETWRNGAAHHRSTHYGRVDALVLHSRLV